MTQGVLKFHEGAARCVDCWRNRRARLQNLAANRQTAVLELRQDWRVLRAPNLKE